MNRIVSNLSAAYLFSLSTMSSLFPKPYRVAGIIIVFDIVVVVIITNTHPIVSTLS